MEKEFKKDLTYTVKTVPAKAFGSVFDYTIGRGAEIIKSELVNHSKKGILIPPGRPLTHHNLKFIDKDGLFANFSDLSRKTATSRTYTRQGEKLEIYEDVYKVVSIPLRCIESFN